MEEGNVLICVPIGNTDWNHSLVNSQYNKLGYFHWYDTLLLSFLLVNS